MSYFTHTDAQVRELVNLTIMRVMKTAGVDRVEISTNAVPDDNGLQGYELHVTDLPNNRQRIELRVKPTPRQRLRDAAMAFGQARGPQATNASLKAWEEFMALLEELDIR